MVTIKNLIGGPLYWSKYQIVSANVGDLEESFNCNHVPSPHPRPPSYFLNSRWENTEQIKHINNQQSYFSQLTRTHISIYWYGSSRAEIRMRSTYYLRKFELPSSVESKYKSHHHSLLTSRETSGLPSVPSFLATFFKKFFQTSKSLVKLYAQ